MNPATSSFRPATPPPPAGAGAAGESRELRRLVFPALGTTCEVRYLGPPTGADSFESGVRAWVETFEARYSRYRATSVVSRINAAAGGAWIEVDAETERMLDMCQMVHALTEGMLDVTAGPLLKLWDFRCPPVELPAPAHIAAVKLLVGWPLVQRLPGRVRLPVAGMALDFGGWGKEWAVDAVAALAGQFGVRDALIDFGHDIRGLGRPPGRNAWHVGLENPAEPGAHCGSVALFPGKGIASSGDYLRHFTRAGRRYGHIVDPRSGYPIAHGVRQVTVLADNCLLAGLLSTTACVLGPVAGLAFIRRFPGAEGVIVTDTERVQTRGFWQYVVT